MRQRAGIVSKKLFPLRYYLNQGCKSSERRAYQGNTRTY